MEKYALRIWFIGLVIGLIAGGLLNVAGCARAEMNIITMTAESFPTKQSVNVIVDAVDEFGRKPDIGHKYPFDVVKTTPYSHSILSERGLIITMTMTVVATEPGQTVLCTVRYNGKLVPTSAGQGSYGQGHAALCVYPPRIPK